MSTCLENAVIIGRQRNDASGKVLIDPTTLERTKNSGIEICFILPFGKPPPESII